MCQIIISQMITSSPGVYSLVIFLRKKTMLTIGALGHQTFHPGIYIYTGSALGPGGLKARLKHHNENYKSQSRRNFWHIDFLLAHEHATLMGVIAARTSRNMECEMNRLIKQMEGVRSPVLGFGASDCKKNCGSHLLYIDGKVDIKPEIAEVYARKLGFGHKIYVS